MKPGLILLLALTVSLDANILLPINPSNSRYKRSITVRGPGEYCAVLDADVFAHAAPSLKDLRLSTPIGEVPYAITLSETAEVTSETAALVQIHPQPTGLVFDLQMPSRPYTDVDLDLGQHDFLATATVSGMDNLLSPIRTPLGSFTLFDFTTRHLSHNAVLHLQESHFRYLHVELRGDRIAASMFYGAQVPPSREAQTLYTLVGASTSVREKGSETIASFQVPAHVPVERVSIELSPRYTGNFDRRVHVTGQTASPGDLVETIHGAIARVHLGKAQSQQMSFPAVMGVNLQQNATIEVAIENGEEAPLPISSVRLEMRQRSICFDAPVTPMNLFYGDRSLSAPGFTPSAQVSSLALPLLAILGPEAINSAFQESKHIQPWSDRHADLMWFLLLASLGVVGMLILHTLRRH